MINNTLINKIISTDPKNYAALVGRLALGIVLLPHGAQKLLGLFGGYGFNGTMGFFTETLGIPGVIAFCIIILESFGALGLILGIATRFTAFWTIVQFIGAILIVHLPFGFFMNWFGNQQGEGFEFHILLIGLAGVLLFTGSGAFSVDSLISKKGEEKP